MVLLCAVQAVMCSGQSGAMSKALHAITVPFLPARAPFLPPIPLSPAAPLQPPGVPAAQAPAALQDHLHSAARVPGRPAGGARHGQAAGPEPALPWLGRGGGARPDRLPRTHCTLALALSTLTCTGACLLSCRSSSGTQWACSTAGRWWAPAAAGSGGGRSRRLPARRWRTWGRCRGARAAARRAAAAPLARPAADLPLLVYSIGPFWAASAYCPPSNQYALLVLQL